MNRAEYVIEIASTLRRIGVTDKRIAVILGIEFSTLRVHLHNARLAGTVLPAPTHGPVSHLERAIAALVHALSGPSKLCGSDATLIITAHRTKLAMRDAAAKLITNGIVEKGELAWLLTHLGGSSSGTGGKIDTTLAA